MPSKRQKAGKQLGQYFSFKRGKRTTDQSTRDEADPVKDREPSSSPSMLVAKEPSSTPGGAQSDRALSADNSEQRFDVNAALRIEQPALLHCDKPSAASSGYLGGRPSMLVRWVS
jgi:hypothetical protein